MKNIVIITGGTSGLGLELVKQFIIKDFLVCNIGRDIDKMKELNNLYGDSHRGFIGDVSDEEFVNKTIDEISNMGNIKILINNAGEASFNLHFFYIISLN